MISFADQSPELAKRVVQSMLTIFVESNLGSSRQDQDSAERFLQRELKDYERRLIDAERKVKDFKMRNLDLLSEKGTYYDRLKKAKRGLIDAQDNLALAESRREEMAQQLEYMQSDAASLPYFETWLQEESKAVTNRWIKRSLKWRADRGSADPLHGASSRGHRDEACARDGWSSGGTKSVTTTSRSGATTRLPFVQSLSQSPVYQEMQLRLAGANTEVAARGDARRDVAQQDRAVPDGRRRSASDRGRGKAVESRLRHPAGQPSGPAQAVGASAYDT
jgi:hypothetical protein